MLRRVVSPAGGGVRRTGVEKTKAVIRRVENVIESSENSTSLIPRQRGTKSWRASRQAGYLIKAIEEKRDALSYITRSAAAENFIFYMSPKRFSRLSLLNNIINMVC